MDTATLRQIADRHPIVFYDGHCGMCHTAVNLAIARDPDRRLRFAPLQGETLRALLSPAEIARLPDSNVLRQRDGTFHKLSDAPLEIMGHLKRPWPAVADLARLIPAPLRNSVYRLMAANRDRFAPRPDDVCPVVPADQRELFLP